MNLPKARATDPKYKFEVTSLDPFTFRVIRKSTEAVLFDTSVGGLVLEDQFLQLSTRLPTEYVYGMGENVHRTFKRSLWYDTYPLFGRDQPTVASDAFKVSDYTFSPLPMLTYRTIGGVLDFYVFLGPSPEGVVQQYTGAIGRPVMPPYWALGFQLCKYGYNSLDNLKTAVDRTRDAGIPHDVQYADIDHMSERRDFTIDNVSFAGLPEYFRQLRDGGMRTIIILDPALVSNYSDYEPYQRMKAIGGFIKWPNDTGYTYPADSADDDGSIFGYGKTVFPDFFKAAVKSEWQKLIVEHRARIDFDGLWIDMNEPAVFGTNDDRPFNWPEDVKPYWSLKCPDSKWDDPPYRTGAAYDYDSPTRRARLSDKTLCLSTVQGIQEFNLFGFTYTGADICGHFGTASAELCKRWMQLGAFYTFSRNHNAIGNRGSVLTETGQVEKTIPVQSDSPIQLSVLGGHILPMQEPARNTTFSRQNPMKLLVALSTDDNNGGTADGSLFWDDGISIDTFENGNYFEANLRAENVRTLF
nr:hypothetical protein BaRGS_033918 [Batillaria attramentaria]